MAVYIETDIVTISDCDTDTNWAGTYTLEDEVFKQGTYSLSKAIRNDGDSFVYAAPTPIDVTGKHIRVWVNTAVYGLLKTKANGGISIGISDGVGFGSWYVAGSDTYSGGWLNICIDPSSAPDSGVYIDPSSVETIVIAFGLTGTAKNVINTYVDYLRYGNGITGSYGDEQFGLSEINALDVSNGYGILEYDSGVYYLTGCMCLGDETNTNSIDFFQDDGILLAKGTRGIPGCHRIRGCGNATGTTDVTFNKTFMAGPNRTVTDGTLYNFINIDSTSEYINTFNLIGGSYYGIGTLDSTGTTTLSDCIFEECYYLRPDGANVSGCSFLDCYGQYGLYLTLTDLSNDYTACYFDNPYPSHDSSVTCDMTMCCPDGLLEWYNNLTSGRATTNICYSGITDVTFSNTGYSNFSTTDSTNVTIVYDYPYVVNLVVDFGEYAVLDTSAWYHAYYVDGSSLLDYNTSSAVTVTDSEGNPIKGTVDGTRVMTFYYNYDLNSEAGLPVSTDKTVVMLCEGDGEATQAKTTFVISKVEQINVDCAPCKEYN